MKRRLNLKYYLAGAVCLLTFVTYLASLHNEFIDEWDDALYVTRNPFIRSLDKAFFRWAFFEFYAANWHPLTWMSHALDYAVWGLDPLGHHLTNNIFHSLNTFLAVLLIIRLMEVVKGRTVNNGPSALLNERAILIAGGVTGLLFGLHPLHVESVAWVAERKDLLCALFFLLSAKTYIEYTVSPGNKSAQGDATAPFYNNKQYLLALVFFVLALLSKPMAVSLPLVLLVLDWYPLQRIDSLKSFQNVVVEKLPLFTFSLVTSVLTIVAQRSTETMISVEVIPISTRMFVAAESLIVYLRNMLLPLKLIPFYPYPQNAPALSLVNLLSIALVIGITIACVVFGKKQKILASVWAYYCITLLPVLGILQAGVQSRADRYMYLPSLGPFFVLGLGLACVFAKVNTLQSRRRIIQFVIISVAIFVLVSMTYLTVAQIGIWKNSIELWSYVVEEEPQKSFTAYNNLGSAFVKAGQFDKAIVYLDEAIALDPEGYLAYNNRGTLFEKLGLFGKAVEDFDRAIVLNSDYYLSYHNRAVALGKMGQYGRALEDLNRAIVLNQFFAPAYFARGNVNLRTGDQGLAVSDFRRACELGDDSGCNALQALAKNGS